MQIHSDITNKSESIIKLGDGTLSQKLWSDLFRSHRFEELSIEFIRCLNFLKEKTNYNLESTERCTINAFVENFMYFFCQSDFVIPEKHLEIYVQLQPAITNIVAISDYETTTPWVIRLATKRENYFKVLTLLNPRTIFDIDQNLLFDISDYFASQWWSYYWVSVVSYCHKDTWERIRRHLHRIDDRFLLFNKNARSSYFPATYVDPDSDHLIKRRINELARQSLSNVCIRNNPDNKKIALITGRWYRSAVYTSLAPMINSLKGHYDLTLVNLGAADEEIMDRDLFEKILNVTMTGDRMDLSCLDNNSFSAVIYPDIGMNAESIFLSNIRIAPIQVAMYGHPASTRGSCIDYFITGERAENLSRATENYSERLVVLPGLGVIPVFPQYSLTDPIETDDCEETIQINCPWTSQKITWPLIDALIDLIRKSKRKILFHFFSGGGLKANNAFIPFAKDIWNLLGKDYVKIYPPLENSMYLKQMQKNAFSIDSFPFGGFNTIIDSLYLNKPVITWKGDYAYNRFASATLEILGLDELIACSKEEYVELILKMIHNDEYRNEIYQKISMINLKNEIIHSQNPNNFLKAIDYLINNHNKLISDNAPAPILWQDIIN